MHKKLSAVLALVLLAVFMAGCVKSGPGIPGLKNVQSLIWSVNSSEKVLKDSPVSAYGYFKEAGEYNITAVRNEYEAGQLILTPQEDVDSYTMELADLKSAAGDTFKKENFSVYNQKYIEVTLMSLGKSTGQGWYPDAILPFDKAVEYGENHIKAGQNQGIWIVAKTPKDQAPGVYTGNFNFFINGHKHSVPAKVTVYDYLLTDEVTAKSAFMIWRQAMIYGGDDTFEAYEAMYEYLLEYRMSNLYLPTPERGDIDRYLEAAVKYTSDPRLSAFALEYMIVPCTQPGVDDSCVDWNHLERQITAFAEYSVANEVNLLEKAYIHFAELIDEARLTGRVARAVRIAKEYNAFIAGLTDKLETELPDGATKDSVIDSVRLLPNLYTDRKDADLYDNGNAAMNFCPMFDDYADPARRAEYKELSEQGYEQWWYGCTGPHNPYPTYHIDDVLVSGQVQRWMQKDYGVAGDLYWCVNYWYSAYPSGEMNIDPYTTPMRSIQTNGEGMLLYPGHRYGLSVPVGTIRMEKIRDGQEEYEMLADINKIYEEIDPSLADSGLPFADGADKGILKFFYEQLYSNARITTDSLLFTRIKSEMYALAALAQSFDTAITHAAPIEGGHRFTVKTKGGVILKDKDGSVLAGVPSDGVTVYSIDATGGTLEFTAEKDGKSQKLSMNLERNVKVLNPLTPGTAEHLNEFSVQSGGNVSWANAADMQNWFGIPATQGVVRVQLDAAGAGVQRFSLTCANFDKINGDTVEITFELNRTVFDARTDMLVYLEFDNGSRILFNEIRLEAGQPLQTVTLDGFMEMTSTWNSGRKLKAVHFEVGDPGDAQRVFYITNLAYKTRIR